MTHVGSPTCHRPGCENPRPFGRSYRYCTPECQREHWLSIRREREAGKYGEGPEERRARRLRDRFNMTVQEYDDLLERQGGGCAVCGAAAGRRRLHVDHDHSCCPVTRKDFRTCGRCVRGLLCSACNRALGYASDDPARLRALAEYLETGR